MLSSSAAATVRRDRALANPPADGLECRQRPRPRNAIDRDLVVPRGMTCIDRDLVVTTPSTMCSFTYHFPFCRRLVWCSSAEVRGGILLAVIHIGGRSSNTDARPVQHPSTPWIRSGPSTAWICVCSPLDLWNNRHPAVQISRIPALRRLVVLGRPHPGVHLRT